MLCVRRKREKRDLWSDFSNGGLKENCGITALPALISQRELHFCQMPKHRGHGNVIVDAPISTLELEIRIVLRQPRPADGAAIGQHTRDLVSHGGLLGHTEGLATHLLCKKKKQQVPGLQKVWKEGGVGKNMKEKKKWRTLAPPPTTLTTLRAPAPQSYAGNGR